MLLPTLRDGFEEVFQIYRRGFSIWDVVGLSAAIAFVTLKGFPFSLFVYIWWGSIVLHTFLDDFRGIMADGNRFFWSSKKIKILQIIIGVWNLTSAIWDYGFSGPVVGYCLHTLVTHVYCLLLITNGVGEE